MKYLDFINRFWALHEDESFTTTEIALYFYLLRVANHGTFKIQFKRNNVKIGADLDVSYNTLCKSRNRLKQSGLIEFKTRNGDSNVEYKLCTFSKFDEVTTEVTREVPCEVTTEVTREKRIDKDKDKEGCTAQPIVFETESQKVTWQSFLDYCKDNDLTEIFKVKKPLTPKELESLVKEYGIDEVSRIILSMENYKDLKKKKSVYLTANTWLMSDKAKKQTYKPRY